MLSLRKIVNNLKGFDFSPHVFFFTYSFIFSPSKKENFLKGEIPKADKTIDNNMLKKLHIS